ncbi:MAG TPA: glycosyltransferase family 9 protein [Xanthomonadales bacterium]|nr:glycosyltransferase family 9 protein [Xanthomonadales bacterium]
MITPPAAPRSICILRLSALGDATHVVPMVHTLHRAFPGVAITWIVGRLEHRLVGDLPGVEFVVVDKKDGIAAFAGLRRALRGRRFDALLQCQVALRANLLSALVRARRRIGYDRARSKDGHGLFVRERIPDRPGIHVLDAIGSFVEPLGARQDEVRWDLPIPDEAHEFAASHLPGDAPTLLVSPCSSHAVRNWLPERYAAVADHAMRVHGMRVALCGGRSRLERETGDAIAARMHSAPIDLIGKDTLKQFLALARRATLVLSPDSGPMHMANAVGTPVLGLHAASNPKRSGPYSSIAWCVDRYDAAARRFRGVPAAALPWGTKLEHEGVMSLIETDAVTATLDRFMAARAAAQAPATR